MSRVNVSYSVGSHVIRGVYPTNSELEVALKHHYESRDEREPSDLLGIQLSVPPGTDVSLLLGMIVDTTTGKLSSKNKRL